VLASWLSPRWFVAHLSVAQAVCCPDDWLVVTPVGLPVPATNSQIQAPIPVPRLNYNQAAKFVNGFTYFYLNQTKCEIQACKLENIENKFLALRNSMV